MLAAIAGIDRGSLRLVFSGGTALRGCRQGSARWVPLLVGAWIIVEFRMSFSLVLCLPRRICLISGNTEA